MDGWVSLHRKLISKPIFDNEKLLKVWIWCLLKATHTEHEQLVGRVKVLLMPGQFVTGRTKASIELNMKPTTTWTYLKMLEDNESIDIKSNNKFSVVSIVNWELYQTERNNSDSKQDNKRTTNGQQTDTNNNGNNGNNGNKDINISLQIKNLRERYSKEQLKIIDEYFDILRWTRKSGKIADSVILKIYEQWEKYAIPNVIYGLRVYIGNPKYHDKKENYCYAIMRNATAEEIANTNKGGENVGKYGNRIRFTPPKRNERNQEEQADPSEEKPI